MTDETERAEALESDETTDQAEDLGDAGKQVGSWIEPDTQP